MKHVQEEDPQFVGTGRDMVGPSVRSYIVWCERQVYSVS